MKLDLNNKLHEKLFDELFDIDSTNREWIKHKSEHDLSNLAGVEIHIEPPTARSVDEVESFHIIEDVMGSVHTNFERKKSNERSKENTQNTQ